MQSNRPIARAFPDWHVARPRNTSRVGKIVGEVPDAFLRPYLGSLQTRVANAAPVIVFGRESWFHQHPLFLLDALSAQLRSMGRNFVGTKKSALLAWLKFLFRETSNSYCIAWAVPFNPDFPKVQEQLNLNLAVQAGSPSIVPNYSFEFQKTAVTFLSPVINDFDFMGVGVPTLSINNAVLPFTYRHDSDRSCKPVFAAIKQDRMMKMPNGTVQVETYSTLCLADRNIDRSMLENGLVPALMPYGVDGMSVTDTPTIKLARFVGHRRDDPVHSPAEQYWVEEFHLYFTPDLDGIPTIQGSFLSLPLFLRSNPLHLRMLIDAGIIFPFSDAVDTIE